MIQNMKLLLEVHNVKSGDSVFTAELDGKKIQFRFTDGTRVIFAGEDDERI